MVNNNSLLIYKTPKVTVTTVHTLRVIAASQTHDATHETYESEDLFA